MCAADKRAVDLSAKPAQIGYGVDTDNSRKMSAAQAGLTGKQAANLEVAWSFAMPKTSGLRGQGVVVGSTLFYPAGQANYVLALDTKSGCVKWATPDHQRHPQQPGLRQARRERADGAGGRRRRRQDGRRSTPRPAR